MIEVRKLNGQYFGFPVDKYGFGPSKDYWVAGSSREDAIKKTIAVYNRKQVDAEKN